MPIYRGGAASNEKTKQDGLMMSNCRYCNQSFNTKAYCLMHVTKCDLNPSNKERLELLKRLKAEK